ncbi:MAG TPA: hypothetical protein VN715_09485 [Roseiarcus sp.]|nr:hypothetical protein [Roseiarcus sp.]
MRWRLGVWRAWRAFYQAYALVSAYREYIDTRGGLPDVHFDRAMTPQLDIIPEIDKTSYVKAYPVERRVWSGRIPAEA